MDEAVKTAALALAVGKDAHLDDLLQEYGINALLGELFSAPEGQYADKLETVSRAALRSQTCLDLTTAPESAPKWAAAVTNTESKRVQLLALQSLEHLVLSFPQGSSVLSPSGPLLLSVASALSDERTAVATSAATTIRAACIICCNDSDAIGALCKCVFEQSSALHSSDPSGLVASRTHDLALRIAGDSSNGAAAVLACGALDAAAAALVSDDALMALALLESLPAVALSCGGTAHCMPVLKAACQLAGAEVINPSALGSPPHKLALPPSPHTIAQSLCEPDALTGEQALRVAASTVRAACSTVLACAAGRSACADADGSDSSGTELEPLLESLLHLGHGLLCRAFLHLASAVSEETMVAAALSALSDLLSCHPLLCISAASHEGLVRNLARVLAGGNADIRDGAMYCLAHVLAAPAVLARTLGVSAVGPPESLSRSDPEAAWVHSAMLKSHVHAKATSSSQNCAATGVISAFGAVHGASAASSQGGLSEGATAASDPAVDSSLSLAGEAQGLIPTVPAASPLLLSEACAQLVRAVDQQLAQRPDACQSNASVVDIVHACILSPFPGPSSAAAATLLALVCLPTGWGIWCLLHTSVQVSAWLTGGASAGEGAPQKGRRMELVYALLAHPRCEDRAGAVQYAALRSVVAAASGQAAQGVQVATQAS